jgi:hypothetical protein
MVRHASILFAGAAITALSACASGYDSYPGDGRRAWEVTAWATARPDGLYAVRTVTVAPDSCYAPGEIRAAPSSLPETIELQTTVLRSRYGPCERYYTDIVHDLPAVRLEPDDRQIEIVVLADGAERNRIRVNVDNLEPVAGYYPRYDPRDPRYIPPRS